jgi:hypothetical protein
VERIERRLRTTKVSQLADALFLARAHGFESCAEKKISGFEQAFGIADISQFTPPPPPKA